MSKFVQVKVRMRGSRSSVFEGTRLAVVVSTGPERTPMTPNSVSGNTKVQTSLSVKAQEVSSPLRTQSMYPYQESGVDPCVTHGLLQ